MIVEGEEKSQKATEKFCKQSAKFKPKSKLKISAYKDNDDEEETDDDNEKQLEMVPIPHPIPLVVPKLIPMPIIIQHTLPFSMFPISLPSIQLNAMMNTRRESYGRHTEKADATRRLMPNAHRRPSVGF